MADQCIKHFEDRCNEHFEDKSSERFDGHCIKYFYDQNGFVDHCDGYEGKEALMITTLYKHVVHRKDCILYIYIML